MKACGKSDRPEEISDAERAALINLLGDDDPAVYESVRARILECGPRVVEWLRPSAVSRERLVRQRASELVRHFDQQNADVAFLAFCLKEGEDLDLESASWLLAQTTYPNINVEAYQALLDVYAAEAREGFRPEDPAEEILGAINQMLFGKFGFKGNEADYYEPENCYLNRVLDRRTGNPITLCLVYLLLARRLHLPMAGIGLPGHFLCRYQSSSAEFYVDAFNGGKLLTKVDCIRHLNRSTFAFREDYLTPISPRRLLLRACANLHQIYRRQEAMEETRRFHRYVIALSR